MQLHPREQFTLTRQLNDPAIVTAFYVRAVIRNAKTDTIIDTVNLTDKTGQRFTKQWLVPADPSGQGFWISIVTSVYTDSGYTTKSTDYGDEACSYLVQERYVFNPNYPVGPDIDYKRIKKMIDEAIKKIEIPEQQVQVVTKEVVKEVRVPEVRVVETQQKPDFTEVLREIRAVGKKVDDKEVTEVPETKETDLSPVIDRVNKMESYTRDTLDKMNTKLDTLKVEVKISNPVTEVTATSSPVKSSEDMRIRKLMRK
jgi:hypothetical protein